MIVADLYARVTALAWSPPVRKCGVGRNLDDHPMPYCSWRQVANRNPDDLRVSCQPQKASCTTSMLTARLGHTGITATIVCFDCVLDRMNDSYNITDTQYCDGLRGPIVIYDPDDPYYNSYDYDDSRCTGLLSTSFCSSFTPPGTTVITLADWYHVPAPSQPIPAQVGSLTL
jgi:hypothetical protein